MKVFFLIPVYNESRNIEKLAYDLLRVLPDFQKTYIFVDDCSRDNTIELINRYFEGSDFYILTKHINIGPGDSFNSGFEWILNASDNDCDLIVSIEGDNTSDLSILPVMITNAQLGYQLVLASVYVQGGGFQKTNLFRKVVSFIANMTFRLLFNIKVLTLSSFYRVFHLSLIREIKKNNTVIIKEKGFICMLELLLKCIRAEATLIEIPVVLKSEMRKGKSKMKILKNTFFYLRFLIKSI
jgi:dolichol-phosphate mannosyltransferase